MESTPAAPPPAIELIGALHSVQGRLEAALDPVGLSLAKLGLLDKLAKADEPVPLRTLPEMCACVRSNITQLVDRLEAANLVRRTDDPNDRRQKRAEITEAGRATHAEGMRAFLQVERELFSGLTPERRGLLLNLLRSLQT
jgi:DNA-binding MarR family transcriptional regulator